jgi:NAD(P)H-quinone oxidoreductase subunit 5
MPSDLLWLVLLGPAALACVGLTPEPVADRNVRTVLALARAAALGALAVALVTGGAVLWRGAIRTETIGVSGVGLAVYMDALSATMFALVSFIGVIVVIYSRRYMDGDPAQGRFMTRLCLTLAAVLLVITAGNLFQFALAWIGTSLGLNRLLLFYGHRPAAVLAARKKFLASRLGELCLLGALLLIHGRFHSLDYAAVFTRAAAMKADGAGSGDIDLIAILLVFTAMLKSAQFPLHGWLIEVMETPTPVSALLHAGIINAGGFLVLRMAGLFVLSTPALDTLAAIGGFTALFGSVVMLTQTSIKVSLAYSTVAQMGFMMLECGLGAFSAALLHIFAHSLYKAHAFLSSGSVIDIARASWTPSPGGQPHPLRMAIAIAGVLAVALIVGTLFGYTPRRAPGVFCLVTVVMLGLIHLVANGIDERPARFVILRTLGQAVAVAIAYFALQGLTERWLASAVPPTRTLRGLLDLAILGGVVVSFTALTLFQSRLARKAGSPAWLGLYAHIQNGFYVNTFANRLVVRFWPRPPPRRATPAYARLDPQGARS